MAREPKYKRVLLKCSGEALLGNQQYGIDVETATRIAKDIRVVHDMGVEVCIVVGGGNIFRGVSGTAQGMDQANADYMGMMATVMNALALQHAIEKEDMDSRVLSAIPMASVCEPYIRRRAERHLVRGRIVIFAAGTGNPFFTTDTAAALRAAEMKCDALLKGTNVDGVYDKDPAKHDDAVRFQTLSHLDVISKDLKVMDAAAISLARENNIPILVFSIHEEGSVARVVEKKGRFTEVI
ncbi:MAG: UMP kinase [Sneathiella sp.]|nr:UMP kinase [Sneathiella sp.]